MKSVTILLSIAVIGLLGCSHKPSEEAKPSPTLVYSGDKLKPVKISCSSNLKAIGLAMRLWAGDHHDKYPWTVSTNQGGTMEFSALNKDGFDDNAALHFQVMSNELNNPTILVCPQDTSKKPAADFKILHATNISYQLRTGTNSSANQKAVLVICPIDGNILYDDGSVTETKNSQDR